MPSASSTVKVEKQISDNALADNSTPLRQAITMIEHKIRNLEKRKLKLESYKELQNAGKTLNEDQKTAVEKFNEVIFSLDLHRDLCKQFIAIVAVSEKDAKKQAKREAALKNQAELARLREILLVQDALNQMGTENVRDDFLNGKNGAAQLTESDLKLLDDLYPAVTPKHEAGNPTAFTNEVQAAAEHLLAVVDGKTKEIFGGTYCQIKEVLGKIHESGYFDQAQVYESYEEPVEQMEPPVEGGQQQQPLDSVAEQQQQQQQQAMPPHADLSHQQQQQIPIESLSIEQQPVPVQQQMAAPPQVVHQPPPQVMEHQSPPSAPPQVQIEQQMVQEKLYHQQQQSVLPPPQQQQPQPPRPITEMLGTGSFFFLQDSEIDPQDQQQQQQQQIPTQTYTNQQFVPGMHMPPPIPMPQQFLPQPPPHVNNMQPPAMNMQPPPQAHQPQQQAPAQKNGNMIEEREESHSGQQQHNGNQKYPPHQRNNYYQNNGYSKDNYNNKDYKDNYNQRSRQSNRNGNSRPQNRH